MKVEDTLLLADASGHFLRVAVGAGLSANRTLTVAMGDADHTTGSAAFADTGTSGHVLGFLDGANSWSGTQAFATNSLALSASGGLVTLNALGVTVSANRAITFDPNDGSRTVSLGGDLTVPAGPGASVDGTNTGDVTLSGQNYLSLSGQALTANAVALGGTNVSGTLTVGKGGTGADLSATGGASQYVKQASSGAAFTVGAIPAADLPALSGLTAADPTLASTVAGETSAANKKFEADRLLGLARLAPGGRLTLTSGAPVTSSDVTGAATVYYTPHAHDLICLWDGTRWLWAAFAETSLALGTLTSGKNYDVFGYLSSGALALESLAWTNDGTRATAVTLQDGRWCKSGDKTRLLLGTFRTTSTTQTEDSAAKRFLSNAYNAVPRRLFTCPGYADDNATTSYTITSTSNVEVNGGTGSKVEAVFTLPGNLSAVSAWNLTTPAANAGRIGLGLDSTANMRAEASLVTNTTYPAVSLPYGEDVAAGYHYLTMLAQVGGGTMTINADLVRAGGNSFDPYLTYQLGTIHN